MDAMEDESGDYQMPQSEEKTPLDSLGEDEYRQKLVESISSLPERERLVMSLYYDDELNFREIGKVLEVSESRVCQIHGQAMLRIQSKMSDWRKHK
jgi:RNA polymerase sigma factor for flagellar operon FliA